MDKLTKFFIVFFIVCAFSVTAWAETQKIIRIVGDHPVSGCKAYVSITNQAATESIITVSRYDMDGELLFETTHTIGALGSIMLVPDDFHPQAQQIEITGPDDVILIMPYQYDANGNWSHPTVFEVTSGNLLSSSDTAVPIETTAFLQYEGDPNCKHTQKKFKLAIENIAQRIYYAFPDRSDRKTWVCSATPLFGECPDHD